MKKRTAVKAIKPSVITAAVRDSWSQEEQAGQAHIANHFTIVARFSKKS